MKLYLNTDDRLSIIHNEAQPHPTSCFTQIFRGWLYVIVVSDEQVKCFRAARGTVEEVAEKNIPKGVGCKR
jgi:hypothetical protein